VHIDRTDSVGPKVGGSLRAAGLISLGVTMLVLLIYVGLRFDFTFAPGAILCLFHDSTILIGIWVLTQQEFGLSMISALLTLLGYSINDTIVVYDRIRENMQKYRAADFPKLINDSINQTLSRTIITSGGTMLSMVPFLFFGGPVLRQFAIAMLIGIVVGTYSSVYVAAPMTLVLRENRNFFERFIGRKG
jgi:preprotein translocase subunit SecF